MKSSMLLSLATTFAGLSLVAVGGANATMPEIQRVVVDRWRWMDDAAFAHLFAISQTAPGPNVLLVSLIGWRLAGVAGLLVTTAAMTVPSSLLAYVAGRVWRRWDSSPWVGRLQATLAPLAVGLVTASGLLIAKTTDHGLAAVVLTFTAAAFVFFSRRSPMWALAIGAVIGTGVSLAGGGL